LQSCPLVDALTAAHIVAPLMCLSKGFVAAPQSDPRWACLTRHWARVTPRRQITGPTFAVEVAQGLPTALVVAATDSRCASASRAAAPRPRAYPSDEPCGCGVGGASRRVAIAAGASDGLGFVTMRVRR